MSVFDVEADGLLSKATKVHVLSYRSADGKVVSLHDYDDMREFLLSSKVLIGHNIIRYDIPLLEKLLGITIKAQLIDTLALSWYLNHSRVIHGLDSYGKDFGVPKPKIENWVDLSPQEYAHRCEEDVKINFLLWQSLKSKLLTLYGSKDKANRLVEYLSFKMDCLREQERSQWEFDEAYCKETIGKIAPQLDAKIEELKLYMPQVQKTEIKTKPLKPFKKDGTYSVIGSKWFKLLKDKGLPKDYEGGVEVDGAVEEPNPGSHQQVKAWLFSLGWQPETFDYKKNEDGTERAIPQVRVDLGEGKVLCPSVIALVEENPGVAVLEGVTVLQHRLSTLEGFISSYEKEGYLFADAAGFTNTLRLKHRVLVNLPGVDKAWGEEIRGCLIAPEGYTLCGSDMSSLEDNTKKHYMYPYDPEYVKEMSNPDFDPHLDLARFAGVVTKEEIVAYVCKKVGAVDLKPIRKNFKVANYSCIYGVGAPKLSRTLKISVKEAQKLIDAYWGRNWAVKELSKHIEVRKVDGEMWLLNPVSQLWYSLRYEKDIFSTLNQGTGVYCFDLWIKEFRKVRPQLTGQFHDEVILCIKEGFEEQCRNLLNKAITRVNEILNLNVTLSVDIQFGKRYSDIH